MKIFTMMAATAIIAGTTAYAQTDSYTATLARPLAAEKRIIANGNYWICSGSSCVIASQPRDPTSLRSCHELQRQVGALTAYGSKEKQLAADKLEKCNNKN